MKFNEIKRVGRWVGRQSKKDFFIQLIDYVLIENNTFKIVNQLEIIGYEKRIPEAIIYINSLPVIIGEKYPIPIAGNYKYSQEKHLCLPEINPESIDLHSYPV